MSMRSPTASVLVLATPVYRATYPGILNVVLDKLPPAARRNMLVVLAAAAAPAHDLALDTGMRAIVARLDGRTMPMVVYATANDFDETKRPCAAMQDRVRAALAEATRIIGDASAPRDLVFWVSISHQRTHTLSLSGAVHACARTRVACPRVQRCVRAPRTTRGALLSYLDNHVHVQAVMCDAPRRDSSVCIGCRSLSRSQWSAPSASSCKRLSHAPLSNSICAQVTRADTFGEKSVRLARA